MQSPRKASSATTEEPQLQSFSVPFEYPVYFTTGAFAAENPALVAAVSRLEPERRHRLFFVVDGGVSEARPRMAESIRGYAEAHADNVEIAGDVLVLPGGEDTKNRPEIVEDLRRRMVDLSLDRKSVVVAIGGGALLDVAGYAAATLHRGVRILRMPTTVESQSDSGVGVKNGINALGAKNLVGTFAPPFAVVNDFDFLSTLSERDRRAGLAEAVKVALIRDAGFFDWLWANAEELARFDEAATREAIRRSATLHLEHIAECGDPFELGSAKPLDFGHWAAHKLETMTGYRLRHGEAVAIGVALDSRYAADHGILDEHTVGRVCVLLERLGFRLWDVGLTVKGSGERPVLLDGLAEFREHLGGDLTLTLISAIGVARDVVDVDESAMAKAIAWLDYRNDSQ